MRSAAAFNLFLCLLFKYASLEKVSSRAYVTEHATKALQPSCGEEDTHVSFDAMKKMLCGKAYQKAERTAVTEHSVPPEITLFFNNIGNTISLIVLASHSSNDEASTCSHFLNQPIRMP